MCTSTKYTASVPALKHHLHIRSAFCTTLSNLQLDFVTLRWETEEIPMGIAVSMPSPFLFCWVKEVAFQAWLYGLQNDNFLREKQECRGAWRLIDRPLQLLQSPDAHAESDALALRHRGPRELARYYHACQACSQITLEFAFRQGELK